MKTYKTIDDAIYEVAAEKIGKRRKNPTTALSVFLCGLALIAAVLFIPALEQNALLARILMLTGGIAAFAGLIKSVMDFTGRRRLYYKPSGTELRRYELLFDTPYAMKVCQALSEGDLAALRGIPRGRTSSIRAVIYKAADNAVMMAQAFESQKPLTEMRIFEKGHFTLTGKLA